MNTLTGIDNINARYALTVYFPFQLHDDITGRPMFKQNGKPKDDRKYYLKFDTHKDYTPTNADTMEMVRMTEVIKGLLLQRKMPIKACSLWTNANKGGTLKNVVNTEILYLRFKGREFTHKFKVNLPKEWEDFFEQHLDILRSEL